MRFISDILLITGAAAVGYAAWLFDPTLGIATNGTFLMICGLARGRAEAAAEKNGGAR